MIVVRVDDSEVQAMLGTAVRKTPGAIFEAIVRATGLARKEVVDNIRRGMSKNLGWSAFAASTIKRKAKLGRSLDGLVDTGRMMGAVHEKTSKSTLVGEVLPGVDYFGFHELGTTRISARKTMAPVSQQIHDQVIEIFRAEIARVGG